MLHISTNPLLLGDLKVFSPNSVIEALHVSSISNAVMKEVLRVKLLTNKPICKTVIQHSVRIQKLKSKMLYIFFYGHMASQRSEQKKIWTKKVKSALF